MAATSRSSTGARRRSFSFSVYTYVADAVPQHPEVDVVVNIVSSRFVYTSTQDILEFAQIKYIAIIAEGVRRVKQVIDHRAIVSLLWFSVVSQVH